MGWALDAFDFTVFLLIMAPIFGGSTDRYNPAVLDRGVSRFVPREGSWQIQERSKLYYLSRPVKPPATVFLTTQGPQKLTYPLISNHLEKSAERPAL